MKRSGTSSSELVSALTALGWEFPFERELSLRPLIAFWEETIAPESSIRGRLARDLQDEVRRAPELSSPINDLSVLTRHHELVDALMAAVFPTVSWQLDHAAALIPFELRSFYATPSFERDLTNADGQAPGAPERRQGDHCAVPAPERLFPRAGADLRHLVPGGLPDHLHRRGSGDGARSALQARLRRALHRRRGGGDPARARPRRARPPRGAAPGTSRRSPPCSRRAASGSAASPCSGRST